MSKLLGFALGLGLLLGGVKTACSSQPREATWPYAEYGGRVDSARADSLIGECMAIGWSQRRPGEAPLDYFRLCSLSVTTPLRFRRHTRFDSTLIHVPPGFPNIEFHAGNVTFRRTRFEIQDTNPTLLPATWLDTRFREGNACFHNSTFHSIVDFENSTFMGNAVFHRVRFLSRQSFHDTAAFRVLWKRASSIPLVLSNHAESVGTLLRQIDLGDSVVTTYGIDPSRTLFQASTFEKGVAFLECEFATGIKFNPVVQDSQWCYFYKCEIAGPSYFGFADSNTSQLYFEQSSFIRRLIDTSSSEHFQSPFDPSIMTWWHRDGIDSTNDDFYFRIDRDLAFLNCQFDAVMDFCDIGTGDNPITVSFDGAEIYDTVWLWRAMSGRGSTTFDFSRAHFPHKGLLKALYSADTVELQAKALIILLSPVHLRLQTEHLEHVGIYDSLSYFDKRAIYLALRDSGFVSESDDQRRFELEYWFARETARDRKSSFPDRYPLYHPISWLSALYEVTLGRGYRPFKLLYWAILLAVAYGVAYFFLDGGLFRAHTSAYIRRLGADTKSLESRLVTSSGFEEFCDCLWFSVATLLAIRLKASVLVAFNNHEKRWILSEYIIGLMLYAYFLFGSKAGSIGMTFIRLFTG